MTDEQVNKAVVKKKVAVKKDGNEQKNKKDELLKIRQLNLVQKMWYIKSTIKNVEEDLDIGRYKAISHNMITKVVNNPMHIAGVFYVPHCKNTLQDGNRTEVTMALEFVNVDRPEERIMVGDYVGYGIDNQDKGPGKAYSYAIKYILLKTFGILTGEGDQDESEIDNTPAQTQLTDAEKADKTAREIWKEVTARVKEMSINEAKQYWDDVQTNKQATLEFIKLNNNEVFVNFTQSINKLIKDMESNDDA